MPRLFFLALQDMFEIAFFNAFNHIAVHLDKAAISVPGKALVAGENGQPLGDFFIDPEVQNGVHHAGHGKFRSRTHRHQKRILRIAEILGHDFLQPFHGGLLLNLKLLGEFLLVGVVIAADIGGDGESGRDGYARVGHLGQACAFAAQ